MLNLKLNDNKTKNKSFGIFFSIVLFLLSLFFIYIQSYNSTLISIILSCLFLLIANVCPDILKPLNNAWYILGVLIGKITNPIILAILFYFVITPTGLILKLFGHDPLRMNKDIKVETYWIKYKGLGSEPDSFKKQY